MSVPLLALGFLPGEVVQLAAILGKAITCRSFIVEPAGNLPAEALTWARSRNAAGENIYVVINPLKTPRDSKARAEDVAAPRILLIDADPERSLEDPEGLDEGKRRACSEAMRDLAALVREKTGAAPALVFSGRGTQAWLRVPVDLSGEERRALSRGLAAKVARDGVKFDATQSVEHLGRLPGFVNHRTGGVARLIEEGTGALTRDTLARLDLPPVEVVDLGPSPVDFGEPTSADRLFVRGRAKDLSDAPRDIDRSGWDCAFTTELLRARATEQAACRLLFAHPGSKARQDRRGEAYWLTVITWARKQLARDDQLRLIARSLPEKAKGDPGAPYTAEALEALCFVSRDPVEGEPLRAKLKKAGVRLSKLDKAMRDATSEERDASDFDDGAASTKLVELALGADAELFHSPDKTAYAWIRVAEHREVHPIKSSTFKLWLSQLFFEKTRKAATSHALSDAATVLGGRALFEGLERPVFVRIGHLDDDVFVDLGDAEWRVLKITPSGATVEAASPIAFRRPRGLLPLPLPVDGGKVDELFNVVHVSDEVGRRLLVGWLVAAFQPRGPFFGLALLGGQGSGKSSTTRRLRDLIDPRTAPLRSLPKDEADLFISAASSWLLAFDNVSSLQDWLSDALCRLLTGGGVAKRELWTDGDEYALEATRPLLMNGIPDFVARPDLADRMLVERLPSFTTGERRTERELDKSFEEIRPRILGALVDAVVCALRNRASTTIADLPRMADAALWVTAAEPALGWPQGSFLEAYSQARTRTFAAALEADVVAEGIRSLVEEQGEWSGTATQLLGALRDHVAEDARRANFYPKTPRALSGRIRRLVPVLQVANVTVDEPQGRSGHANERVWRLRVRPVRPNEEPLSRIDASTTQGGKQGGRAVEAHTREELAGWGRNGSHESHESQTPLGPVPLARGTVAVGPPHEEP